MEEATEDSTETEIETEIEEAMLLAEDNRKDVASIAVAMAIGKRNH